MENEIKQKLVKIINELYAEVELDDLNFDEDLQEMHIDSISFIKMILGVEKEFGFKFSVEEMNIGKYKNLNELVSFIASRRTV